MEVLLRYLPGPQPAAVRYSSAAAFVLVAFAFRTGLWRYSGPYGFIFFILPIVAAGLMFDRGTGFFAVALSLLLVAAQLSWDSQPAAHVVALLLFAIVGCCLVLIAEGLHRALEAANAAQRTASLLLDEMSHRVKNKFAMMTSIIHLQARRSPDETRRALEEVARRLNVMAQVHDYLQLSRHDGKIDMSEYLPRLCASLNEALLRPGNISMIAAAEAIYLPPDKALALGLIVNELVTNAVKYAFPDRQGGQVKVELTRLQRRLLLVVEDNGRGYAEHVEPGLGSKLIVTFAQQLAGAATWKTPHEGGTTVMLEFPE